jgi:hypothetical protein
MPPTTLDDLKLAWNELNRKLERQNALTLHELKQNKLARFRSGLRPLVLGQTLQLILGAVIAGWSAEFWISHITNAHLMICGVLLQAYGIMFIVFAARDLALIRRIDYSAPVVVIQKRLAELRAWHIRAAFWYGMTGSVIWLPVMLLLLHALGTDLWIDKPNKVYWLIASAFACLAFNYGLLLLARSPGRCGRSLRNSRIGRSVNRAQESLDEIENFERELA